MSVAVTDSDGTALAGAGVAWRRFSGAVDGPSCDTAAAITDVQGHSQVSGLPSGTYRVVVTANGFAPQTRDIIVGFATPTLTVRLLTAAESEPGVETVNLICDSPSPPESLPALVAASDAIIVGRIRAALLDPDYTAAGPYPAVRTRYDLDLSDIIKAHPHLGAAAQHVTVVQSAGKLEWGKDVVLGCSRQTMRPAAIITAQTGQSASDFIRDLRAVIQGAR